jgi:hypothetical protein
MIPQKLTPEVLQRPCSAFDFPPKCRAGIFSPGNHAPVLHKQTRPSAKIVKISLPHDSKSLRQAFGGIQVRQSYGLPKLDSNQLKTGCFEQHLYNVTGQIDCGGATIGLDQSPGVGPPLLGRSTKFVDAVWLTSSDQATRHVSPSSLSTKIMSGQAIELAGA